VIEIFRKKQNKLKYFLLL